MNIETEMALLAEQAVALRTRIVAMHLPRHDRARQLLESELNRVRLDIRALRRIRDGVEPRKPLRKLIPYAGAE